MDLRTLDQSEIKIVSPPPSGAIDLREIDPADVRGQLFEFHEL